MIFVKFWVKSVNLSTFSHSTGSWTSPAHLVQHPRPVWPLPGRVSRENDRTACCLTRGCAPNLESKTREAMSGCQAFSTRHPQQDQLASPEPLQQLLPMLPPPCLPVLQLQSHWQHHCHLQGPLHRPHLHRPQNLLHVHLRSYRQTKNHSDINL